MDLPEDVIAAVKNEPPPPAHAMVDLETLGTGNKAVILSIGACRFDKNDIFDSFHVAINPRSSQLYGLEIEADTVLWWLDPDREDARQQWLAMPKVDLPDALIGFAHWMGENPPIGLWGNGSVFDNVKLKSSYDAVGIEYPVHWAADQCYRTVKYRAPDVQLIREGTHHDALDDAICQAKHLQAIIAATGMEL